MAPHDETVTPSHDGDGDFQDLIASQPDDRLISERIIKPTDTAAYFHTGGTTGSPKLAIHTHANQVFTAWASVQLQGLSSSDVTINGYPLFHVAGVLPGSLTSLSAGIEIIIPTTTLLRNEEVRRNYWRLVEKYKATSLSGVPTVLAALANVPLDGADISSIRYCRTGAAPLPPELAQRFEMLFGLHVHEALGMTEMAGISAIRPPGVRGPAGCVGFPIPYSQTRIVALDENGGPTHRELGSGEHGMILFKAPMFSGFLSTEATASAFTNDGWLATGDVGWMDHDGRLHLSGRSKDLIIRSGHNIDPKVIEDALGAHPQVQLCAAVGAPDAYAGELPVAFAVLIPEVANVDEQALLAWTKVRVDEPPARPKFVAILQSMPMTNVGKIFKPELRRLAVEKTVNDLLEQMVRDVPLLKGVQASTVLNKDGRIFTTVHVPGNPGDDQMAKLTTALEPLPLEFELVSGGSQGSVSA